MDGIKRYEGKRRKSAPHLAVDVRQGGASRPLELRKDLYLPWPPYIGWGYRCCGGLLLAVSLLAGATGQDDLSLLFYGDLEREIVRHLPDSWSLPQDYLGDWLLSKIALVILPTPDETRGRGAEWGSI